MPVTAAAPQDLVKDTSASQLPGALETEESVADVDDLGTKRENSLLAGAAVVEIGELTSLEN